MRRLSLVLVLAFGLFVDPRLVAQTPPAAEAVILNCSALANPMTVRSATRSSGAPAITTGANCAQVIADLQTAGYRFAEIAGARSANSVIFTLVKPPVIAQCMDGLDNDGDGLVDMSDPQCTSTSDNAEGS